jgi:hypothetical protein
MGIGKAGSILAPVLSVSNLPVALARVPGKIALEVEGGLKILLAWTLVDATMAEWALACQRRLEY